jgi:Putative restriction endonuclease
MKLLITNDKSMSTTKSVEPLYTFEEYLTYDDGTEKRYELEDEVLLEMPPASDLHEAIMTFLLTRSQPPGWECIPRGSTSPQKTGGGSLLLWGGRHESPVHRAGKMPTPQD